MRAGLPSGTVTFMFTDIEGSTALLHEVGPERYAAVLQEHRDALRAAFTASGGVEVDTQGDAFLVAFPTAAGAVAAAREGLRALADGDVRVRVGLHTGAPLLTAEGYVGEDVHLGARIAAAGHGGQVLLSAPTAGLVDVEVTDLGEHRLKDFGEPVRIFQLGTTVFPPLKTISHTNLPRPVSSFVGRAQQVADVIALLREGARLVTLTGTGGSGKTRLAIEVATELVGTVKAGVFWVGLDALRDPALVLTIVAQTIGAKGGVAERIGDREMVLLVDNIEHVIEAAGDLATLVEQCPNLTLLVTSRERLRVRGEVEYAVPPLESAEAVELFCARAKLPPDEQIAELCRRLDNLPLAVELAAARVGVLSPVKILDRMAQRLDLLKGGRDAEARQQTLRATIDWSHALLTEDERRVFARFSVFAGGADLDAVEAVTGASLDLLESLVDKSLVRTGSGGRFFMLETIRDFARERLRAAGEAEQIADAHARYFLAEAQAAETAVLGLDPNDWLDRLEADHDNLRASLDRLEQTGDTQTALLLGGTLWEFWCLRAHFAEGWRRLDHLLEIDDRPTLARAKALTGAVHLGSGVSAWESPTRARAKEALELHRKVGDDWSVAFAEHEYAVQFAVGGDFEAALEHMEPCVRRWQQVGDEHRELQAMRIVAWASNELGDHDRHERLHQEIVERARLIGDHESEWWALSNLALVATREGRHVAAVAMLNDAYDVQQRTGDASASDMTLVRLGCALTDAEAPEAAAAVFSLADRLAEQVDFVYPDWFARQRDEAIERVTAALGETAFSAAWERGRAMNPDEAFELAAQAVGPG